MTSRVPRLRPEDLDRDQRAVYDTIAGGPRARGPVLYQLVGLDGALEGPFNAMLLQPRLGAALQEVGASVRYETALSDRAREIAVLLVAAHWDSDFEWYAHEAVGRHVGLTEAELLAVKRGDLESLPEADVARTTTALLRGDLDDSQYAEAVSALGEVGVFELTTLVGYYALLALQLRVFRVPLPAAE